MTPLLVGAAVIAAFILGALAGGYIVGTAARDQLLDDNIARHPGADVIQFRRTP